jgi:AraC-like DNA-binding protein
MEPLANPSALNHLLERKHSLIRTLAVLPITEWPVRIAAFVDGLRQIHPASSLIAQMVLADVEMRLDAIVQERFGTSIRASTLDARDLVSRESCKSVVRRILDALEPLCGADAHLSDRFVLFVRDHLDQRLNIASVSAALECEPALLVKTVRTWHHTTVHQYVALARLAVAFQRIRTGEKIEAVRCFVGYRNRTSFFREFQRCYGMLPRQARSCDPAET